MRCLLRASMAGTVVDVDLIIGQQVDAGQWWLWPWRITPRWIVKDGQLDRDQK